MPASMTCSTVKTFLFDLNLALETLKKIQNKHIENILFTLKKIVIENETKEEQVERIRALNASLLTEDIARQLLTENSKNSSFEKENIKIILKANGLMKLDLTDESSPINASNLDLMVNSSKDSDSSEGGEEHTIPVSHYSGKSLLSSKSIFVLAIAAAVIIIASIWGYIEYKKRETSLDSI